VVGDVARDLLIHPLQNAPWEDHPQVEARLALRNECTENLSMV
jgi:hypothetical protein